MNLFFAALEKQDFETAKKYVTPETQKILVTVQEDAQKYKEFNDKPQTVKVEVLERNIEDASADYKVRLIVGDKIKEEKIHCVKTNDVWLFDVPKENVVLFKHVVFFDRYDEIIVLHKNKYLVKKETVIIHTTHKKKSHKKKSHKRKTYKGITIKIK